LACGSGVLLMSLKVRMNPHGLRTFGIYDLRLIIDD
jgi:hypothetical protein